MKLHTLPLEEVWKLHDEPVEFSSSYTEAQFDRDWESLRNALREALARNWRESCFGDADFALSDDRTNTWAQAGGIQSEAMLSPSVIGVIFEELSRSSAPDKWGVLLSVECPGAATNGDELNGEFLVKNGAVYVAQYRGYEHGTLLQKLISPR